MTFFSASAAWALASALGVAALGVYMLVGGRSRPRGGLPFGLFALLWGAQIVAFQVGGLSGLAEVVGGARIAAFAYLSGLVCLIALPYFLVEFGAVHARAGEAGRWRVVRGLTVAVGLGTSLLLLVAPSLLFGGVGAADGRYYPTWGPLFAPVVNVALFGALGLVLWMLTRSVLDSPTPRLATRSSTMLAGVSLYVAFAAANNLAYYAIASGQRALDPSEQVFIALFALVSTIVAVCIVRLARHAARAVDPADRRRALALVAALAVPATIGILEAWVTWTYYGLNTVGLWRLAGVGIIAYGIARWRIYDLPQRAASAAATSGGVAVAATGGAAAFGLATAATSSGAAVPVVAGLVVLAAAIVPSVSFARRLFGIDRKLQRPGLEQSLYGQRIDAYRAALEASLARGTLDEDQEFLAALRERFGITAPEERVLLHYARSSIIVSRDRQAWDAYERLRLLGEGGAGRTWLARDRSRDRLVVLKETLPSWQQEPAAREAVLREARLAAKVRHPNVVTVEEVVEAKGAPVIVMEYLEGGSLADVLRARGTLPWDQARQLALDVLRGLEAIHAGGIVHRDVKPSNVLLTGEGVAKVADFGIAVAPVSSGKTMVLDAPAAGTLAYMAPEAREGRADRRADVYGAGALLHEMLYGAPPHLHSPVVVRKDLPAALTGVLAKALAPAPEARYATAHAFADELARI